MGLFERLFGKKDRAKVAEQETDSTEVLPEDLAPEAITESKDDPISATNAQAAALEVASGTDDTSQQGGFLEEAVPPQEVKGLETEPKASYLLKEGTDLGAAAPSDKVAAHLEICTDQQADVPTSSASTTQSAELSDEAASEQAEGLDPAARGAFILEREPELELVVTDDKALDQTGESLSQHETMKKAKHDRAKSEHSNESTDASTEDQAEINAEYQVAAQAPAGSADQPAEEGQKQETLSAESDQEKYKRSLKKTRTGFSARLNSFFANFRRVDEDFFEDLEELLILSDVGVHVATTLTEELRYEAKLENAKKPEALKRLIIEKLVAIYEKDGLYNEAIHYQQDLTVMLFVGVNGVGKTTSIGKLAYRYKQEGKKVMLVAADTFRAGAVAQLVEWGRRVDVPVITGPEKADPASVVFDGVERAVAEKADILLIDTAGRLQNKDNLMAELEKIGRIIKRVIPDAPHETLLALDASTGQNALSQAKEFSKITPLTGLILTKIDGTAKGGIVLAIRQELDIPVKLIGFGEAIDDIGEFHSEDFMKGLLEGIL
ncbi:TPA: signal recognition particle-docking protein FtsY [Streptococcus equi subsp. zooepidemicus]|uniref:signal recognition particle-docking protein FtsY n=1 Tax=Streptococcus equi TaxID=1336 RepID=UPI000DA40030|nr:signal recognition particle-docking protein FtsY [Streptococcus equi]SQF82031.1 cell division protein FtsY [Streptococcus equi subsp. zooepidemicus]HEL0560373.1 signal recognition particle-docking protein FtsY [Streptococcus equi subsp. zooepidemicus]HEL0610008.1 signal recognition particle-docking protein FtsY [Streptococcus equi subsp. zooepidemicus]HEL0637280.1 signal recognition particle-docking protein FtsY [Streptococcus equi subsp. zooepidemicus]HEL0651450.1 signal recognition partic